MIAIRDTRKIVGKTTAETGKRTDMIGGFPMLEETIEMPKLLEINRLSKALGWQVPLTLFLEARLEKTVKTS